MVIATLAVQICGNGSGDSDESEDDSLGEHFKGWLTPLTVERMRDVINVFVDLGRVTVVVDDDYKVSRAEGARVEYSYSE